MLQILKKLFWATFSLLNHLSVYQTHYTKPLHVLIPNKLIECWLVSALKLRMLSASEPENKDFHALPTHLPDVSNNVSDERLDLWFPSVLWLLKLMQSLPQWKYH